MKTGPFGFVSFLFILACLSFGSRLFHLDFQSLFRDEGHTVLLSSSWMYISQWVHKGAYPPLYWVIEKLLVDQVGFSVWSLRLLSALAGSLTVPLLALTARNLDGERAGQVAGVLALLSTYLVSTAQEARPYAFFGLLFTLLGLALSCSPSRPRLVCLFATLLLYTDYLALPLVLLGLVLFARHRRPLALALLASLPLMIFVGPFVWRGLAGSPDAGCWPRLPLSDLGATYSSVLRYILAYGASGSAARVILSMSLVTTLAVTFLLAPARQRVLGALALLTLALSVGTCWGYGATASAESRAAMVAPLLFIASGCCLSSRRHWALVAAFGCLTLGGSVDLFRGFYYFVPHRGGWKEMGAFLARQGATEPLFCYDPLLAGVYYPNSHSLGPYYGIRSFCLPGFDLAHKPHYYATDHYTAQDPNSPLYHTSKSWQFVRVVLVARNFP